MFSADAALTKSRISAALVPFKWGCVLICQGYIKTREAQKLRNSPFFLLTISMTSVNLSTIGLLGIYPYYMLAALFFSIMLFRQLKKGRNGDPNGLPLPPGPKGYPLIGNLFDMPLQSPWVVYDEWRRTYGKTFIINDLSPP